MESGNKENRTVTGEKELCEKLLFWYREHRRILPWREEPTPYHVWVSEIMLQQTRVAAVLGYYERFIRELPDIRSLAEAEEEQFPAAKSNASVSHVP